VSYCLLPIFLTFFTYRYKTINDRSQQMSDSVLYEVQGHIATITLNRPERHNALNGEAYSLATELFKQANADGNVRCIVFTGAGRSFCSGDDVVEIMASGDGLEGRLNTPISEQQVSITPPLAISMQDSRCPIINAVNGAAVGFGMELTLLCDVRIASDRARFSEMFIRRGIIATAISYDLLPNIVGPARAAEMLLTGEMIDAQQAQDIGLVSRVTPHDSQMQEALSLAEKITANPPLAVERAKQALRMKREYKTNELDGYLSMSLRDLSATKDHKESVAAFLEKREAVYKGE
jgi:enoyl-CoA hydratase/carnithine racemase